MSDPLECLKRLRVDRSQGEAAPHQPCLLLTLICEIQTGHIKTNLVQLTPRLYARYYDIFEIFTGDRLRARPWMPLWALKNRDGPSGKLWSPQYEPSIRDVASQMGQPKSLSQLESRFQSAALDSELFSALASPSGAIDASEILISRYLSSNEEACETLRTYLRRVWQSGEYEKHPSQLAGKVTEESQRYARSAAFRSLVLEAYDYRCAASRLRYITPDYRYLVEAAHLIPFAVSQDDRPTNGLALTPNLHWAMDNHLIAPGPDHNWHVSPTVDALVPDNRWLRELDGYPLILPRDSQWHPSRDALAWRLDKLLR